MKELPDYIYNELVDGLMLLNSLNLPFTPPTEAALDSAIIGWTVALTTNRSWSEIDVGRLQFAFAQVAAKVDRWPSPKLVLEHLPKRPDNQPKLADGEVVPCPADFEKEIDALVKQCTKAMQIPTQPIPKKPATSTVQTASKKLIYTSKE